MAMLSLFLKILGLFCKTTFKNPGYFLHFFEYIICKLASCHFLPPKILFGQNSTLSFGALDVLDGAVFVDDEDVSISDVSGHQFIYFASSVR